LSGSEWASLGKETRITVGIWNRYEAVLLELREWIGVKPGILIVDNHRIYRDILRDILAKDPNIEIVAEAGDGLEGLARASETVPDVVCMNVALPGMNGIEATRRLVAIQPGVKVIALSTHSVKEYVLEMLKVGAVSYVTKGEAGEHLLPAIHAVLRQQTYLCPLAEAAVADTLDAYA
jgi:DNA-binding NarL/FixJ family response regulator